MFPHQRVAHATKFFFLATLVTILLAGLPLPAAENTQLAFPGAEGFGRFAQGGRGGDVYHVTTLQDEAPGSLREGIRTATGPRTIVFDISGTIQLKKPLVIEKSFITLAGQTAPGDGICLKDHTFRIKNAKHIIVRYIRFRLGDENKPPNSGDDCTNTDDVDHLIFDHVTTTWGIDGNHDLRRGGNFTLQWSIYAEALNHSLHGKGEHAMLASFRDLTGNITLHHNLFASSRERHPTLGGSPRTDPQAVVDFRNNVIYNLSGATNLGNCRINFIGNTYIPGPDTPANSRPINSKFENKDSLKVFLLGNEFQDQPQFTQENHRAIDFERWSKGSYLPTTWDQIRHETEFEVGQAKPATQTAGEAAQLVLNKAGASLHRDAADERVVNGVKSRTNRLINSQNQVNGWPALNTLPPPKDTDQDGMPDHWESTHHLNPHNPTDRNQTQNQTGYTNLETYLNSLCR